MTQEEVQLIYDYLHENYEYREGEFFSKIKNRVIGHIDTRKGVLSLTLNSKIIGRLVLISIAKAVFIYHFKRNPKYIKHINKNPMDNKIENLIEDNNRKTTLYNEETKGVSRLRNTYRVTFSLGNGRAKSIASWGDEVDAKNFYKNTISLISSGIAIEESIRISLLKFPTNQIKKSREYPKGIYPVNNKFIARLYINKRAIHLGTFNTPEEAHAAYLKAKEEYAKNA